VHDGLFGELVEWSSVYSYAVVLLICVCVCVCTSVFARNLFKGVHDEIHSIKKPVKPCLLKYF